MQFRKPFARVLALAVAASPALVVVAAEPAHAATMYNTVVTLDPLSVPAVEYGSTTSIYGSVKTSTGGFVPGGIAVLQALPYGATTWSNVATDTSPSYLSFPGLTPTISTQYKVVFSGYATAGEDPDTYLPSESTALAVPVKRKVTIKYKGLKMWGKVTPDYGKKKLVFKKKQGKKYVAWFKVKTKATGKWKKDRVPGGSGTKFIIIVKSGGGYLGSVDPYRII